MTTLAQAVKTETDKVYIKKDSRIHHLMINAAYSNTSVGVQITPEIAAKIIAELANYLLDNSKK